MKTWLFRLVVALFLVLCSPARGVYENLGVRNPVGSGPSTVPQSSLSSGLVNTPDPFDSSGNLVMTGNVRRGMYFRGNMPYQSPTSFTSSLGTSSLSSFLRDSAGPEDIGSRSAGYGVRPYYSGTETVTTTRPGGSQVVSPASAVMTAGVQQDTRFAGAGVPGLDASLAQPMSFMRGTAAADSDVQGAPPQYHSFRELSLEPQSGFSRDVSLGLDEARRLNSSQTSIRREGETSTAEQLLDRNEQAQSRVQRSSPAEGPLQYRNQGTKTENLGTKLQTLPVLPIADAGQSVSNDLRMPNSAQSPPGAVPTLQDSSSSQKSSDWPSATQELKTGSDTLLTTDYRDLAKSQTRSGQAASSDTPSAEGGESQASFDRGQRDALERLRQQLNTLTESVELRLQGRTGDTSLTGSAAQAAKPQTSGLGLQPYKSSVTDSTRLTTAGQVGASSPYDPQSPAPNLGYDRLGQAGGTVIDTAPEPPASAGGAASANQESALDELAQMSRAEISGEARRIMGPYTSPESLSDSKFNAYITAADEHLQAGRYYQAADCFSLAAVYRPEHLAVLAGKGHALFAAGEYMSSALFLSRALTAFPEYLQVDVDLTALLGGPDQVARRLADIEQWYARSGSAQLQFLMSYVYFRTGRLTEARRAIEAAYQKTPQSPAVQVLKTAIDRARR